MSLDSHNSQCIQEVVGSISDQKMTTETFHTSVIKQYNLLPGDDAL